VPARDRAGRAHDGRTPPSPLPLTDRSRTVDSPAGDIVDAIDPRPDRGRSRVRGRNLPRVARPRRARATRHHPVPATLPG
jgi:hypothetical protein